MKRFLLAIVLVLVSCGEQPTPCSRWHGQLGAMQLEGNHAWVVSQVLTLERLSGPDAQHKGVRLQAAFIEGIGKDVPVQLIGHDAQHTYASATEQSVRFVGSVDAERLIGRIKGTINKASGDGAVQSMALDIHVTSLPIGTTDFECRGDGQ